MLALHMWPKHLLINVRLSSVLNVAVRYYVNVPYSVADPGFGQGGPQKFFPTFC